MKRLLCLILSIALALCCLTGCESEKPTVSVAYDLSASPSNIDPQNASSQGAMIVLQHAMEGLYRLDENGAAVPALAAETKIENDGRIYTFTLSDDASWYYLDEQKNEQTKPLTAHDFVFAFRRLLRAETRSPAATRFYCIKNAEAVHTGALPEDALGVAAPDDKTVQFTLNNANDAFLYLLTTTYAFPCNEEFFESTRGRYGLDKDTLLSNGAYRISFWDPADQIRLAKNSRYPGAGSLGADQVRLRITKAESDRTDLERLLEETVDAMLLPGDRAAALSSSEYAVTMLENEVFGLLLNQKNETLANENVRRAIALCFDRTAYGKKLPAHLKIADRLVPASTALFGTPYAGSAAAPALDIGKAQNLYETGLTELGKTSVNDLTLLVNGEAEVDLTAHFLQVSQLLQRDLSMYIRIETVNASTFKSRLASGNYDIAAVSYSAADSSVLTYLEPFLTDSPSNTCGYSDESVDAAFGAVANANTAEEAAALCTSVEQKLLNSGIFIPMLFSSDAFVTRVDTTGILYHASTGLPDFRNTVFH